MSAVSNAGTFELLLFKELLGTGDIGLEVGLVEPGEHEDGADKEEEVAASGHEFAACKAEVKILPAHDVLDSEHAEVVLVELQVGLSTFDADAYLQTRTSHDFLLKYLNHITNIQY